MNRTTWSPFQSEETKRICDNMTPEEKEAVIKRSALYGVWVAITFALPIGFAVAFQETAAVVVTAAILMAIHVACIPIWLRLQRRFFANTQWAREQGITADELRLFSWSRKHNAAV